MNKTRCLIVDDESIAQRIIASYLDDLSSYEVIASCKNAMEAMSVLNVEEIDLMFLDIEMPKLTGLDFLKTLRNPPAVILTTAHRNYALESYEHEVVDYLLKPISFERFVKAINRYKKNEAAKEPQSENSAQAKATTIYLKSDRKTIKLITSDITYIEGMNNYLIVHTSNKKHIVYRSFSDLMKELDSDFVRVHKSFVVNKNKIESFNKEELTIEDKKIPIGKTYKKVVEEF